MRINGAKGHYYVQVKDATGRWETVGELNAKNLGLAFGMMMEDVNELEKIRVQAQGIKHGAIYDPDSLKEFEEAAKDREGRAENEIEMFRKSTAKTRKERKKAMRKLVSKLKIPTDTWNMPRDEFNQLMDKEPDKMTPKEREFREEVKKAHNEGRLILT
jgi:hypothetical protein